MKQLVILIGALCAIALLFVCTSVEFDNPLDEKGNNFLFENPDLINRKDEAVKENANGVSAVYDTNSQIYKDHLLCDRRPPTIALKGDQSVTIDHDDPIGFQRLVGNGAGGWADVVTWSEGSNVTVKLTRGTGEEVNFGSSGMPWGAAGNTPSESSFPLQYQIVYIAKKSPCPDGTSPDSGTAVRGLVIAFRKDDDNRKPFIQLIGGSPITVPIGGTYADPGVTARDGNGITEIPLRTIELFDHRNNLLGQFATPNQIQLPPTTQEADYKIMYHVTSPTNGLTNDATRYVEVRNISQNLPTPTIVLNPYSHRIGGATLEHPDTALPMYDGVYVEKGVKEVYYIGSDGNKVPLPDALARVSPSSPPSSSSPTGTVRYELPALAGQYQAAQTTRNVRRFDGDCEAQVPPSISFLDPPSDAISLSASNVRWANHPGTWRTTTANPEEEPNPARTVNYFVHYGGLDPEKLTARSQPYTMTYVGMGQCGGIATKQRTVTVTP